MRVDDRGLGLEGAVVAGASLVSYNSSAEDDTQLATASRAPVRSQGTRLAADIDRVRVS